MGNINNDIKQTKFDNEQHKAIVNIIYTSNWINILLLRKFRPLGITPQQYNILRILRGQNGKPASIKLIIDRMLDKMSNASRLVDKLYDLGCVNRTMNSVDRRQVDVVINATGLKLLKDAEKVMKSVEKEYFGDLKDSEASALSNALDKLRK